MVCTLIAFSVPFHWRVIHTEIGGVIVFSQPVLGFYFAGASLICAIVWFVLAIGFKASRPLKKNFR